MNTMIIIMITMIIMELTKNILFPHSFGGCELHLNSSPFSLKFR